MTETNEKSFKGSRLRLARIFHGLSLEQLGEKVSVTRQYIQKLEVDPTISLNKDMLAALAEALKVEAPFFFDPPINEVQEEICHFRKRATTPLHIRKRALSYGTLFNLLLSYLEFHVQFPPNDISLTQHLTGREEIENKTLELRKRWGLGEDCPIDNMLRTIENAGGVVTTFDGVSDKIDAFSYLYTRPVIVRSLAKKSVSRARFDLAHELGHLILHSGLEDNASVIEEEANYFASAFLMPRSAFAREFPVTPRINWNLIYGLKIRWGASIQAIVRRAYDLKILSALQYRQASVYIARHQWRIDEPFEDEIKAENPEIVHSAFDFLKRKNVGAEQVAQDLHISLEMINKFGLDLKPLNFLRLVN